MQVKAISACPETTPATSGDVSAVFEGIFSANYVRVRKFLWFKTGSWDLADELTQATFVRLWSDMAVRGRTVDDVEHVYAMLRTLAGWELQKHRSTRRARVEHPSTDEEAFTRTVADPGALGSFDMVDARVCAGQIIADLPQDYRRVLSLHLLEDLAVAQVAEETGLSRATVRATVAEGLRRLRSQVGAHEAQIEEASRARREHARQVYRESIESGAPLTLHDLAVRFGQTDQWAHQVVRVEGGIPRPRPARDRARLELRAQILDGTHAPGTRMPASTALAPRWNTLPGTVCEAFRALAAEGLLVRGKGRAGGFYVATAPLTQLPTADVPGAADAVAPLRPSVLRDRVMAHVTADLDTGRYAPGTALPPTRDLAQRLDVSYATVRMVYQDLVRQGRVTPAGRGSARVFLVAAPATDAPAPRPVRIPAPRRSPES